MSQCQNPNTKPENPRVLSSHAVLPPLNLQPVLSDESANAKTLPSSVLSPQSSLYQVSSAQLKGQYIEKSLSKLIDVEYWDSE